MLNMDQSEQQNDLYGTDRASKEARKNQEQTALEEMKNFQEVMSTKAGRKVMWGLLAEAGVYQTTFTNDAMQMSFNEGKRKIGLIYLAKISSYAPTDYRKMLDENRETTQ